MVIPSIVYYPFTRSTLIVMYLLTSEIEGT